MQDGGVIPVTGFPRVDGKAMRNAQGTTRTWCKTRASHTTHIRSRKVKHEEEQTWGIIARVFVGDSENGIFNIAPYTYWEICYKENFTM